MFALDVAKGAIAARGRALVVDGHVGAYVLGVAAIIGHMLPVDPSVQGWARRRHRRRRDARASSRCSRSAIGVVWFVLVRVTHKASVASIVVVIVFPIAVALAGTSVG